MNNEKELVVPFNQEIFQQSLYAIPGLACMCIFTLFMILELKKASHATIFAQYVMNIAQWFVVVGAVLFTLMYPFTIYLGKRTRPVAILNEDGINVDRFGCIPWHYINKMDIYTLGTPIEHIGIWVKDVDLLSRQATLNGKISLFWTKIFGTPHAIISNTTLSTDEILSFARKFLNH